jgi:hypothetical protein
MNDFNDFSSHASDFDAQKQDREAEFRRLVAEPSSRVPAVGDRVVVAAGLLGLGWHWIRMEGEVLEVGEVSVKVRIADSRGDPKVMWVHPALITDVLPAATTEGEGDA